MTTASPLLRWLSASLADTAGRLLLQIASTAIFARLLLPEDFGLAALAAVLVGVASAIVTNPIEEALAQRKTLRSSHLYSALGLVLLLAAIAYALIWLCGQAQSVARNPLYLLLPGFSIILFAEGPIAIYTAVARRQRRFSLLAWSNLTGLAIGTAVGVWLAYLGTGVWSLLAVRIISRFTTLFILLQQTGIKPRIRFSVPHLKDLSGFTGWLMAGRLIEAITDAVFQLLVNQLYGLAANGYLNMAMRIVEPLRGAAGAIGHNIASAFYFRLQTAPDKLGEAVAVTISESAWLLQPLFLGLAAIAPTLILLLSGPGWEPAIPLAICLAVAASLGTMTNFLHSGLSARGRSDLGFIASGLDLIVMICSLFAWSSEGLIAVGFARLMSVLVDVSFALYAGRSVFTLQTGPLLRSLGASTITTLLMICAVTGFGMAAKTIMNTALLLACQILFGILVYAILMAILHKNVLHTLLSRLTRKAPMS